MKGNSEVLEALNRALADELTAINQYMVHSEMCDDWGYVRLHKMIEKRAIEEMKHAESLIQRIIFLEGSPTVSRLNEIHVGKSVGEIIKNDLAAEHQAIKDYQSYIRLCLEHGDAGSRELLEHILQDEETHTDWLESQLDQIEQMGIENYLALQLHDE